MKRPFVIAAQAVAVPALGAAWTASEEASPLVGEWRMTGLGVRSCRGTSRSTVIS
ncbi:hypothetical protein [Rhodococcus sp. NBC_00297]|uniref:hypothetical protein n=1 Tax=Rhodococcus sp. NBC_00297 TaxID=2976005 RepID=UPI002E2BA4C5|nr:hypothetical protein [Rhodococcus sp. NBC_00297]